MNTPPNESRRRQWWPAICLPAALLLLTLVGNGCAGIPEATGRPTVLVSVLPHAFLVEKVAGDLVEVVVMLPPGASPALYEPDIARMKAMARASLYVKVGHPSFPFERTWLETLLAESDGLRLVDASEGMALNTDDPHVWVSPAAARRTARRVAQALKEILPQSAFRIDAGLAALLAEIDALDAEIRSLLAAHRGRRFLVFHPAWSYFADEYQLEQVAVEHGHKEPTPSDLAAVIRLAREEGLRVIFVQPQFSAQSAEVIASEIGGRVVLLDTLAPDWADNLRRVAVALSGTFAT